MSNCDITTEIYDPDGEVETFNVACEKNSLDSLKSAVAEVQTTINTYLTDKIEAKKGKEPVKKKLKKDDV